MTNCIEVKTFSPFNTYFMYLDVEDYLADQIFIDHKLRVKFKKGEFKKDGSDYVILFVKVPRKKIHIFRECMKELRNKMLLCGHKDYEETFEDIIKMAAIGRLEGMTNE